MRLFDEIVCEVLKSSYKLMGLDYLEEANLNRIIKHGEEEGFIIISANRSVISDDIDGDISNMSNEDMPDSLLKSYMSSRDLANHSTDDIKDLVNGDDANTWLRDRNKTADKELKNDIISAGYSYSEVYGGYHGQDDVVDSFEPSYIVYNKDRNGQTGSMFELIQFAIDMCGKYHQESVYVKMPGRPAFYMNSEGEKVSKTESDNTIYNDDSQMYFTTTSRDKTNPQKFTSDIQFPGEKDDYKPEKILEGKLYRKNIEYVDKIKRTQNGEIFL